MPKKPVLVQFDEDLLERVDEYADETGRSRSAVVRDAVERYIVQESASEKDRRLVQGYKEHPDTNEFEAWAQRGLRRLVEDEPW